MAAILSILNELVNDYTLRTVAMGTSILGIVSGALGCYAFLRKQSLMGDAMSHAALPGVVLAFMLTQSKAPFVLLAGAMVTGWLGMLFVMLVTQYTRIKEDSAMGLVLSVLFGFGLMLLTFVQRSANATQAGLDKFLFGQAATLLQADVITMAVLGGIAIITMVIFWKEFMLLSFDAEYGASLGFNMKLLDVLLITLIVIAIVIGLQSVGVILMSAMIVAPASAARQWTNRMGTMVILSAIFGMLAGISGTIISSMYSGLSTGPTIVLSISAIVIFSMLFAPKRGLIWRWTKQLKNSENLRLEAVLLDLYHIASKHKDRKRPHSARILKTMASGSSAVNRSLHILQNRGWVARVDGDEWILTEKGYQEAEQALAALNRGNS